MSKKIYDILPPKMASKKAEPQKVQVAVKILSKKAENPPVQAEVLYKRARRFPLRETVLGGFIIVILAGFYFAGKIAKADVEIWPTLGTLEFQKTIVADTAVKAVDVGRRIIPAQYIVEEQESWQQFDATGSSSNDVKAQGTIIIYNKL